MDFNKFTLSVLIQVLLIAATSFLMIWSYEKESLVVAKFTFTMIWIIEIIYLLYYVTQTNRSLKIFLESLHSSDFVRSDQSSETFSKLNFTYNEIINVVKNARIERESQYHYFQYTLELIPVGVMSFNSTTGNIDLFNTAAKELLERERLSNINQLNQLKEGFENIIRDLKPGITKVLDIPTALQTKKILLKASEFELFQKKVKVISLQNIKNELDDEEMNAWQKLISVLRHEVMNSVGPVSSLTKTLLRMFRKNGRNKTVSEISDKTIDDAVTGLESIESRSQGMISFVQSYRELTKIPQPVKNTHRLSDLLNRVNNLMKDDFQNLGIEFEIENDSEDLSVYVDDKQITQVLINIVKNASEAFPEAQKNKIIKMRGFHNNKKQPCIAVEDNGTGISDELQEQIFIPFFTTKRNGSGIGLNFARQIMHLHNGRIILKSKEGEGSSVILTF